jgi:hypothetical protein
MSLVWQCDRCGKLADDADGWWTTLYGLDSHSICSDCLTDDEQLQQAAEVTKAEERSEWFRYKRQDYHETQLKEASQREMASDLLLARLACRSEGATQQDEDPYLGLMDAIAHGEDRWNAHAVIWTLLDWLLDTLEDSSDAPLADALDALLHRAAVADMERYARHWKRLDDEAA